MNPHHVYANNAASSTDSSNPFGEDLSHRNTAQESAWASTNADARAVFSYRESLLSPTVRKQMIKSIRDYYAVYWLSKLLNSMNVSGEIVRCIVDYAYPGAGTVVPLLLTLLPRDWESKKKVTSLADVMRGVEVASMNDRKVASGTGGEDARGHFRIYVRPRPMLEKEAAVGNYHVISCSREKSITLHCGRVGRSGNRLTTEHRLYSFDRVFSENTDNQEIGNSALGEAKVMGNKPRTVICYGQTGTGKTYTFSAILDSLGSRLCGLDAPGFSVYLQFYEVHGKKCYDLMNSRNNLRILSDSSERVHALGATVVDFKLRAEAEESSEDSFKRWKAVLEAPLALRSTQSTQRNDVSSRSHSIFTVTLINEEEIRLEKVRKEEERRMKRMEMEMDGSVVDSDNSFGVDDDEDNGEENEGEKTEEANANVEHPAFSVINTKFRLVDLAGSEQNADTGKMAAKDHKESADINTALMSLKECIRRHRSKSGSNYRAHLLTRILRECFTDVNHRTTIFATVSPTTIDTMHTLNTLNHVAMMQVRPNKKERVTSGSGKVKENLGGIISNVTVEVPIVDSGTFNKPVSEWTAEEVRGWIAVANGGKFSHIVLPPSLRGSDLLKLNEMNLSSLFDMTRAEEITARGVGEGSTWVISANAESGGGGGEGEGGGTQTEAEVGRARQEIGRELFQALRIENKHIAQKRLMQENKDRMIR
mmetsp:Transcript_13506/g.24879  ORF Transcript_13506/g.24879 Transcript_13506/m.24879 type:complete len:707 (-) Transcript_13506:40-2160(-)